MNTNEIAKSLLTSEQNINNVITFKMNDYKSMDKKTILNPDTFINIEHYVMAFQVSSVGDVDKIEYANIPGFIFCDWHLNNQNVKRKTQPHYIWDSIILFKNELVKAYLNEIQVKTEKVIVNPFENIFKENVVQVNGIITVETTKDVIDIFINSKHLYFVNKDSLYGTQ